MGLGRAMVSAPDLGAAYFSFLGDRAEQQAPQKEAA